ncbi:HipA family kinase [Dyadobacter tibetensis]|uniref:HipA family kinase n=1 Tax=Dyadobacter tibetensis TaxID=1211851 RepID=UPI0004726E37|nr:HipA family kinase [Dyadobacter tibetensis]
MNQKAESQIRNIVVDRYITPLREGGSLPAIVEGNDGFRYVLKFRGAGQGLKALIADFIGGEIARCLGFRVPEMVFAELDEAFGRTEPDEEIQDLLKASCGINLGVHYLSGSMTFDAAATPIDAHTASGIVWLDHLITNVDRTARNTNMLLWNHQLWLIDHGASLYFHHNIESWKTSALKPFLQIKDHVLLSRASEIDKVGPVFNAILTSERLWEILSLIPDEWLLNDRVFEQADQYRQVYLEFLLLRLQQSVQFVKEASHAK